MKPLSAAATLKALLSEDQPRVQVVAKAQMRTRKNSFLQLFDTMQPPSVPKDLWAEIVRMDSQPLECDGLTRVLVYLLSKEGVEHRAMQGTVWHNEKQEGIPMHYWIELDGGILDFRARMWLGNTPDVPHGFFNPADTPCEYDGDSVDLQCNEMLFHILTM
jgi:hypothetical protein